VKVLIVEQLSEHTLRNHAPLISAADVCIPLSVSSGVAAGQALEQGHWWVENLPLLEGAVRRHAAWVHRVVQAQNLEAVPCLAGYEALVAYGLEFRLRPAVLAQAYLHAAAQDHQCALDRIDLHVVGDDPYLWESFTSRRDAARPLKSVSLHSEARGSASLRRFRERAAASAPVRRLLGARDRLKSRNRSSHSQVSGSERAAALFILNQRSFDVFVPALKKLVSRGWSVPVLHYNEIEKPGPNAESFADAARRAPVAGGAEPELPAWTVTDGLLAESPVSEKWLRIALNASWLAASEHIVRHRRLLRAAQPKVVISYSVDTMGLALRGAAQSLGIPSVFINHGPQGPVPSSWFFGWTAWAMAGQPCVDANTTGPAGERSNGLIPVGYPAYDALLARAAEQKKNRPTLEDIGQSRERPRLVLAFAEYGANFWVHTLQRRLLQMIAEVLPSDCYLVCKLHPSGDEERIPCERILASMLPPDAFAVVGEQHHTTPELLAACDVAVASERCMALTDAIFMNRPAVGVRFPEIPPGSANLDHPARGPEFQKCCRVVHDTVELRDALIALTRSPEARQELMKNRKQYIERFYVASDGRASDRIADLIDHLGEHKGVDSFVAAIGASLLQE
jgi:hypothetical protein